MKSTNREKKYENLEDEKKKLFEELTEEILNSQDKKKLSNLETENEELKNMYISSPENDLFFRMYNFKFLNVFAAKFILHITLGSNFNKVHCYLFLKIPC